MAKRDIRKYGPAYPIEGTENVAISDISLRRLAVDILEGKGHSPEHADVMTDVMMYSQLRGGDQGFIKLVGAGIPKNPEAQDLQVVYETPISARIDGGQQPGMVVMHDATQRAIDKADRAGVGIIGTFNTSSSTGAVGYYTRSIAEHGSLGIAFSGALPLVAPEGTVDKILAPNAISIASPKRGDP